ncbi:MAG: hypothetical protein AABO41_12920 [Acidobacteriota bacterium]
MNSPEIMFSLWYVHGGDGLIYSLRARAYVCTGNEEEDLAFLQRLAPTDYLIAKPFSIPEPFHIRQAVMGEAEDEILPVAHVSVVTRNAVALGLVDSRIAIFEEAIKQLGKEFPAQSRLRVPENPLVCITPLVGDEDGNIEPEFRSTRRI